MPHHGHHEEKAGAAHPPRGPAICCAKSPISPGCLYFVVRALKELERDGAIALHRSHIDIRDAAKLERWTHADAEVLR